MHSGLRGNVSTYRLDHAEVASMVKGNEMPPPARILSAIIGVTFVGPKQFPEKTLPDFFIVRRYMVCRALEWLRQHNPIYKDIDISQDRLNELPINGVPDEILAGTKFTTDVDALDREMDGYVPEHNADLSEDTMNLNQGSPQHDTATVDQPETYTVGVNLSGVVPVRDLLNNDQSMEEVITEPAVIPIMAHGVVDVAGDDVPDNDILAHAFNNTASDIPKPESFHIRRGSAFINEYARVDDATGQRTDGGPSNANHLLGSFPVLFPYGMGGFEVGRPHNVPYEVHARWALQYADKRFRKDFHFIFQVFGVIQKRNVCRAATIHMKSSNFQRTQHLLSTLKPADLMTASREET
ncbi:hypothetical protein Hypma_009541 [Hypsizygus marmoreus]|uniref:DUF6570 domain-containing protein n=1 Tax=Hypsizygus marmoreus TaxID=39966 RepID=A0A369JN53_HYPMA|nr:hypothetical protein Hypma_009541 [Hypsizygus marmoreus]